ncbi:MAG: tRNA pseudouridine(55) synthase TruB [Candidatus Omnitrophota bacterium]
MNDLNGILIVDKEKHMTSHDVVDFVRGKFCVKKVGHAGTLDPNATGVLVLLLGKATKLSNTFLNEDKEYEALMKLGEKTDSGDCDGALIKRVEVNVSESEIRDVMKEFLGEQEQVPPMVSAKKIKGKKLYELARAGVKIKREPKKIVIELLDVIHVAMPLVRFRACCSKGTYIRQLADDIGERLGCLAHLTELRRLKSGSFSIDKAVPFSELFKMDKEALNESVIRV